MPERPMKPMNNKPEQSKRQGTKGSPFILQPSSFILRQVLHPSSFRRAFTLMELLVVLAITAILMVIMFVPLSRAIDMVRRAEAQTKGQDSVRTAARRIERELAMAMEVFEPRPLQMWGFNAWT